MPLTEERLTYWKERCMFRNCCYDINNRCTYGNSLGNCAQAKQRQVEERANEYQAISIEHIKIIIKCPECNKTMEIYITPEIIKNGIQLDDFTCNKIKYLTSDEIKRLLKEAI